MTTRTNRLFSYSIVLSLILLSVAVYWNSLANDFVNWDDDYMIVNNPYIRSFELHNLRAIFTPPGVLSDYRPIRTFSYTIDYHFWELNPLGYHITNMLCNSGSVLFVYLIAVCLSGNTVLAAIASALFAVLPVHVEAVTWLSGRREVLSTVLALLAFYTFQRVSQSSQRGFRFSTSVLYAVSLIAFILAIFTKQSVIVLPFLLVLAGICFRPAGLRAWRSVRLSLPFFLAAFGFVLLYFGSMPPESPMKTVFHGGSAYSTFLTMIRTFAEYLYALVVPQHLSASYGIQAAHSFWEPPVLSAALLLGSLLGGAWWAWKKEKFVFFGIAWFFIALLPVSNIIPISTVKADRHLYFPSLGFCLVFAWLSVSCQDVLQRMKSSTRSKTRLLWGYWFAIAAILCSYAVQTVQRNRDWKDSETLWAATLDVNPTNPIALNNLGLLYAEGGRYEQALELFGKLLDSDIDYERIDGVLLNVGHVYAELQDFEAALNSYQQALLHNPDFEDAYTGMGRTYLELDNYEAAIESCRQALQRNPNSLGAHVLLGDACVRARRFPCAIQAYESALIIGGENYELSQKLERAKQPD